MVIDPSFMGTESIERMGVEVYLINFGRLMIIWCYHLLSQSRSSSIGTKGRQKVLKTMVGEWVDLVMDHT